MQLKDKSSSPWLIAIWIGGIALGVAVGIATASLLMPDDSTLPRDQSLASRFQK
ncbi:hypothetical protein [Sandaracinobacteroides saxicola]|uniref:Uncharacterized protein n=1 Tax=Sandaracinobacteroides saxicola TaxID=2759707 RepID=A0A7G5IKQ0_9SPHN|nr:hypothetical protein [Sandaracinobacteroides saxicola]QMW23942.1 hypothetical protein H3309_05590 [Sandaracinobacteroides saxicola]